MPPWTSPHAGHPTGMHAYAYCRKGGIRVRQTSTTTDTRRLLVALLLVAGPTQ